MVNGIHDNAADPRPHAHPSCPARLADADVLVVQIPHLSDRRQLFLPRKLVLDPDQFRLQTAPFLLVHESLPRQRRVGGRNLARRILGDPQHALVAAIGRKCRVRPLPEELAVAFVPTAGVRDASGAKFVLIAFNGKALRRNVHILSQRSGGFLVDGLVGGENVITTAPEGLKDGQKIRIKGQS